MSQFCLFNYSVNNNIKSNNAPVILYITKTVKKVQKIDTAVTKEASGYSFIKSIVLFKYFLMNCINCLPDLMNNIVLIS